MPAVRASKCPTCGAPLPPDATRCEFCQQYLTRENGAPAPRQEGAPQPPEAAQVELPQRAQAKPSQPAQAARRGEGFLFERRSEPNENAFTFSAPKGWIVEGGIQRANLMNQQITGQAIAPKLDMIVKKDPQGSVALRVCPEVLYVDTRYLMFGFYPQGSVYNGYIVQPCLHAQQFLAQLLFPWMHPQASQVQLVEQREDAELVERYRRGAAQRGLMVNFQYTGAVIVVRYTEGGARYEEQLQCVIENMGQIAMGIWSNKDTLVMRAPEGELARWRPMLWHIVESSVTNPAWWQQEQMRQGVLSNSMLEAQRAEQYRAQKALETQRYVNNTLQEIADHRSQTQAEIRNDQYLNMTSQEEYVNPYTNQIDMGSNQWSHRWVTENGDEYYSNWEGDDPNEGSGVLERRDWKRTQIRPRGPAN